MAKNKKLIASVAAVATSAVLLLGGTLAWQSTNQTALNEASDVINPGGRLHDDFNGENKDVYVENFADEDIYARVRLEEFFEIIVNYGTEAEKTHPVIGTKKLKDEAVADPENNPSGANLYDYTYVVHKFNTTDNKTEDAGMDGDTPYWKWTLGGSTVYMPTFNKNKDSLAADLNGNYVNAVGGISNRDDNQYENYVKYTDGETLEGTEIYDDDANDVDDDGILEVAEIEHTAKPTGSATLMSMQEWIGAGSPVGEYWVYDTDGWVYWADAIKPDSATGLLLDGIELNQKMDDTWYYAINVVAQFVTADDLGSAEDGTGFYTETDKYPAPSEDALKLLDKIGVDVGNAGETPDDPADPSEGTQAESAAPEISTDNNGNGSVTLYRGNTYLLQSFEYMEEFTVYFATMDVSSDNSTHNSSVSGDAGNFYLTIPEGEPNDTLYLRGKYSYDTDLYDYEITVNVKNMATVNEGDITSVYAGDEYVAEDGNVYIGYNSGVSNYATFYFKTADGVSLTNADVRWYIKGYAEDGTQVSDSGISFSEDYADGNSATVYHICYDKSECECQAAYYVVSAETVESTNKVYISAGSETDPAYEPNLYTNAQTYVAGDSVSFGVYVYDETYDYDLAELTADNLSITATAADDSDVSGAITTTFSSDGYTATATLDTTGLTGAVTVAAVYTDAEGNEYPAEPITINEVFNASQFLTLDGKQTNVVHPGNSYTLAYTGESDSYSFALTKGSDVAALDDNGNTLTITGDAAEYAQIAITVTDEEGNVVETASLTVTYTPIVKVVAPEGNKRELEVTPASNSDWVTVLADESVSLFMGDDVPLTITDFSYAGDYDLTPDEVATINDDGTSITPHLGSTIVSTESEYTSDALSFEVSVTMEVEFQYSVSVNYSLNGSDAKLADESVIFLSETDTITFYASSDQPTPATQFEWKIGEHGNVGTENENAFGPLEENEYESLNGVSTNTTGTYSIQNVAAMEKQLDYHFYVSADNHNHAWFQVIFGEPAIDGADTIMQGDTQDYYTNDLKDYTYSVTHTGEGVEISQYGELYVPKDVPVGTVLTITATPDGHDGNTLTKEVTVVALDYSSMVLYVGDYESFGEEYYTTDYTTFTLSVEAFDRNGYAVSASDLKWSVTDSGDTPIDNILTENEDDPGTYTLDLSEQTGTIYVHVNYTGDNAGENSSVSCDFYYENGGGGEEEDAYLGRIEMAYSEEQDFSKNSNDSPVPIIDTAGTRAVYFEAFDTNGYTYSNVIWSCDRTDLVDAAALASGKVIAADGASVASIQELTITATDNTTYDTDSFTVMMYDLAVHTLVDTIDSGDYYHIFQSANASESSTKYCVIRHDLPLPYCMLHLDYIGADEHDPDLWNLIGAYGEMLVSPEDARESVEYISICTHGQEGANDNYPQDAEPMFSVASENSRLYWLGLADGESFSEVYPGDTLQVTSTRLDDNAKWSVYNATTEELITNITTSKDDFRSRLSFTIPEGTIGYELVITQTIGDEKYSIRTTVADPGPTFTVMLNGEVIASELPTSGNVNLPICGLTNEVTVTVSSTYKTYANGDWIEDWHVSGWKNEDTYYDKYFSPTDDTITFQLDPTEWELDASIDVDQSTDSGFWTLYLLITEAEEETPDTPAVDHFEVTYDGADSNYYNDGTGYICLYYNVLKNPDGMNLPLRVTAYNSTGEASSDYEDFTVEVSDMSVSDGYAIDHDEENPLSDYFVNVEGGNGGGSAVSVINGSGLLSIGEYASTMEEHEDELLFGKGLNVTYVLTIKDSTGNVSTTYDVELYITVPLPMEITLMDASEENELSKDETGNYVFTAPSTEVGTASFSIVGGKITYEEQQFDSTKTYYHAHSTGTVNSELNEDLGTYYVTNTDRTTLMEVSHGNNTVTVYPTDAEYTVLLQVEGYCDVDNDQVNDLAEGYVYLTVKPAQ